MKKSISLPCILEEEENKIIKRQSFNDFFDLNLNGDVKYISYGQFLNIKKKTTREERQCAIKNHYYNKK